MRIIKTLLPSLTVLLISLNLIAQNDSIVFINGNYIVGEIKELKLGVIKVETGYSDSDFAIEWDKISYLSSHQVYIITISNGERYYGSFTTDPENTQNIIIQDQEKGSVNVKALDIVYFKIIDQTFISRLDLSLSLGYTLTKANNNQQFSGRVNLGYLSNTDLLQSSEQQLDLRAVSKLGIGNYLLNNQRMYFVLN